MWAPCVDCKHGNPEDSADVLAVGEFRRFRSIVVV